MIPCFHRGTSLTTLLHLTYIAIPGQTHCSFTDRRYDVNLPL